MKNFEVAVRKTPYEGMQRYTYTLGQNVAKDYLRQKINVLLEKAKEDFPNAAFVDVLIEVEPKYSKKILMEIGQDVASGWGGECLSFKTYPNCVQFSCQECGERFSTILSYSEIEKKYANYLK